MLKYAYTRWIFPVVIAIFFYLAVTEHISRSVFFILLAFVILFNFIQAFRIRSSFFIPAFCKGNKKENSISITFDDGPGKYTQEVLTFLKNNQIPAAFFVIGNKIDKYPELLKKADEDGHIIGNHSFAHSGHFAIKTPSKIRSEIEQTNFEINRIIGKTPRLFRPPFGVITPFLRNVLLKMDIDVIGWSVRSFDTLNKGDFSVKKLKKEISAGKIILLHDTTSNIIWLLEQLLKITKEKGLEIVGIDKLLSVKPYQDNKTHEP